METGAGDDFSLPGWRWKRVPEAIPTSWDGDGNGCWRGLFLQLFGLFGFVPKGIHLGQSHVLQLEALLFGFLLDVVEAADELLVRVLEGVVGVDVIEAGCVDEREEEIAKFRFHR